MTALHLLPKVRSNALMASAAGQPCSLRIASFLPGGCCAGPETTVGAHLPVFGRGMSTKCTDLAVAYACSRCHDLLDGRDANGKAYIMKHYAAAVTERLLQGLVETHARMVDQGLITVRGGEII